MNSRVDSLDLLAAKGALTLLYHTFDRLETVVFEGINKGVAVDGVLDRFMQLEALRLKDLYQEVLKGPIT